MRRREASRSILLPPQLLLLLCSAPGHQLLLFQTAMAFSYSSNKRWQAAEEEGGAEGGAQGGAGSQEGGGCGADSRAITGGAAGAAVGCLRSSSVSSAWRACAERSCCCWPCLCRTAPLQSPHLHCMSRLATGKARCAAGAHRGAATPPRHLLTGMLLPSAPQCLRAGKARCAARTHRGAAWRACRPPRPPGSSAVGPSGAADHCRLRI